MHVVAYAQPTLVPFLEPQPPPELPREINGNGTGNGHTHALTHSHHPHPEAREFVNGDREVREVGTVPSRFPQYLNLHLQIDQPLILLY